MGRAPAAAGVFLILILLAMVAFKLWPIRKAPAPVDSDQPLVRILGRDGHAHQLEDALPLRNDDQLWVSCKVPQGARVSMFWLDSEGKLTELIPEVVAGETADFVRYPWAELEDVVRLQGPPGTEFVLVCARPDRPVVRQEIEELLGAERALPTLPDRVILRLGLYGVEPTWPSGSRSISEPVASDLSGTLGPLRFLQRKLRRRTSFFSGVAFPHVAD